MEKEDITFWEEDIMEKEEITFWEDDKQGAMQASVKRAPQRSRATTEKILHPVEINLPSS